ncbi:MAG: protein kinase [Phycisphaeraceae bacterium]|nr:protein kinase [Phycisphaeraceae bacterium]
MGSRGAIGGARRAAQIRRIIEEVMVRRSRGEGVTDAEVIAAHGDVMPELARELSLLSMLERARESAVGRSRTGRRVDGPIEPLGEDAFAGFRVVKEIRRGGQGVVYEAVQASTGRRVAIKMMREGLFSGDRDAARFEREVRILGQLEHPGVVGILASGIRGGHFYYAMDYVEGVPLDQYAESIGRRVRDVMAVMEKVADAVNAAHLRGIIHRDLKPGNVLVDGTGVPRILDFGLARIVSEHDVRMTATGQFVGSMPWASPEQAGGDPSKIDLRTDVYSLGVMLYQALTGKFPYDVDAGPREAMENIAHAMPARLRSVSIDGEVEAITLKCLSKEPERRYQSAGDLAADIRRYLAGGVVLAHRPSFWYSARTLVRRHRALVVGGAAVVAALVLGLIGTTAGLVQASASKRTAVRERDEAQRHAYAASLAAADSALRVADSGTAKTQLRSAPGALRGWEWRYLASRADDSRATLGLPPVCDARVTPDGTSLLSIGRDGVLRLTDLDGKEVRWSVPFPGELDTGHAFVIGYSRDGRLAVTQNLGLVVVWNLADGGVVRRFDVEGAWGYMSASFSPDGKTLLTSGRSGTLRLWDMATGEPGKSRVLSVVFSACADFSPDGRRIAASVPWGVTILDAGTLEVIREVQTFGVAHPDWGWVRWSPDGAWAVASRGPAIVAVDPDGKREPVHFLGGAQNFLPFAISADGGKIAAGSWDRAMRIWNFATGALEATLVGHEDRVLSVSFAEDRVITAGAEGVVKAWDPRGVRGMVAVPTATLVEVLPPGDRALAWGRGDFALIDLEAERLAGGVTSPVGNPWAVSVSKDGRRVATSEADGGFALWSLEDGSLVWRVRSESGFVLGAAFSVDGSLVASAHERMIEVRDAKTGELKGGAACVCRDNVRLWFNPKGGEVAVGQIGGVISLLDTATWKLRTVPYPEEYRKPTVLAVAYKADGSLLATCDSEGGVLIWETASWRPVRRLNGMPPATWSVAFSPDGSRLAVGSQDRMIHLFDTRDWREVLILRGHTGTVHSVSWTPDGRKLVSTGNDGTVRIWDAGPAPWVMSK